MAPPTDGDDNRDGDGLIPARGLLIGVRWGSLAVAVAIGATLHLGWANVAAGVGLAAIAGARTAFPVRLRAGSVHDLSLAMGEAAAIVAAILATGAWSSPYLFCLAVAAVVVGYRFDLVASLSVGLFLVLAVTGLSVALSIEVEPRAAALGGSQVVLLFALAGYARRIFRVEEARVSLALDRVTRLTEANDLLFELHRIAQTLPVSLELGDTLALTGNRVRDLFHADVYAVLLRDEATKQWQVAAAEGTRARGPLNDDELAEPARRALQQGQVLLVPSLAAGEGLAYTSSSGLYASLRAHGSVLGLVVVEHRTKDTFTELDARLLEGIAEQAALAIDNARMFQRLRTVGAHEERSRIARDLHDRVGQSLAYLAFELDRLAGKAQDTDLADDLGHLRNDVRRAVSEIRETLYDLRSEVSEQRGITEVLQEFLQRVEQRSGLQVQLDLTGRARLPLTLERELLRIAQEAIMNVERHASATTLRVSLRMGTEEVSVGIVDDGVGFEHRAGGRIDSYGLLGMRERASAIGASLDVSSAPGRGTTVRCRVRQPEQEGTRA